MNRGAQCSPLIPKIMKYIIYFKSREKMSDKSTWAKEPMPKDATLNEIRHATKYGKCEGFAIVDSEINKVCTMEWIK